MIISFNTGISFSKKTRIAFVLFVVIPALLVALVFIQQLNNQQTILFCILLALISILLGFTMVRRSADNLSDLTAEARSLATGMKHDPIQIKGDLELHDIADSFNLLYNELQCSKKEFKDLTTQLMVYARDLDVHQKKSLEETELRAKLGCYVGKNVVDQLANNREGFLKDEKRVLTILFADIRSFTTIAEQMEAEEVLAMLNEYFDAMVRIIFKHDGILDKFVGDELMALFGLLPSENPASVNAVQAALEMQLTVSDMMQTRNEQGKQVFEVGIGVNTGQVIVGNVGAEDRMDYTVIGDTVNVAARFEQMAEGHEVIIGKKTWQECGGLFNVRRKGEVKLKNRVESISCYEVIN